MNEKTEFEKGPPKRKKYLHTTEYIDVDAQEYVKENYLKTHRIRLYMRFCGQWITLDEQTQDQIFEAIMVSDKFIVGNKDYTQPVELLIQYDSIDDSWKEVERRKPQSKNLKL